MSELISGKDVVIAILSGKDLLWKKTEWEDDEKEDVNKSMWNIEELLTGKTVAGDIVEFYLKPRTILINGIEAPACGVNYKPHTFMFVLNSLESCEYSKIILDESDETPPYWWSTEEEIKQVVSALRSVFKGGV